MNSDLMTVKSTAPSQAASEESQKQEFKKEILVLEDDLQLQTVIKRIVRSIDSSIQVTWASTLEEGLVSMKRICKNGHSKPLLVLADMYLPNLTVGTSLWEQCKIYCPDTPFLFMSSMGIDRYLKLFSTSATPPLLHKPFSIDECKATLSQLLVMH